MSYPTEDAAFYSWVDGRRALAELQIEQAEKIAVVTVTAAQILDLLANPVVLVPSAGANAVIVPIQVQIEYTFGGTPFSNLTPGAVSVYGSFGASGLYVTDTATRDDDAVWAATGANFQALNTVLLAAAANANAVEFTSIVTFDSPLEQIAGLPLVLANYGSEDFNAGDGSLKFTIRYNVITLA